MSSIAENPAAAAPAAAESPKRRGVGLSLKLLVLTILFVMVAEVLIYVPSVANFRRNWLSDRVAAAQIASMVLEAAPSAMVPRDLEKRLVDEVGAMTIAIRSHGARRLLAVTDMPPTVARDADLRDPSALMLILDAFDTLTSPGRRYVRVLGQGVAPIDQVEIVMDEGPLRAAMLRFSGNLLLVSLLISGITAVLVNFALHRMIVRPVLRLSDRVTHFAADPEDTTRIVEPSGRGDEIGRAEESVAAMQRALARELREKKHLAEVGLAVSKINHDLRNILTSAQLISDRLAALRDPAAKRFAPKLITALDRAIAFSQSILDYGKAAEREPQRRVLPLAPLVDDLHDGLGLAATGGVRLVRSIDEGLVVDADPEQLYRVLLNLGRNAAQALRPQIEAGGTGKIEIGARREGQAVVIDVADDGPGVPPRTRATLFQPFRGSATPGGTGLGLAIAAEIVHLHGGRITLVEAERGARFRIVLPDR